MTNFNELGTFEYDVHGDGEGDGLPRIWWHNGDAKAKTPGDFYTRAESWAGELPAPWAPADRFDGEAGYAAKVLRVLPITYRSQAFLKTERNGQRRREYLDKWVEGASLHTEILCLCEGVEGPVVWSVKGSTGKAVTGKGGIFAEARRLVILEAEKRLKKKVPMHAFWLPIGTLLKDGKPYYHKFDQGGTATPPALRLPGGATEDVLNALYAGRATIEEAGALREEYEAWRLERRGKEPQDEGAEYQTPAQVGDGRNVPQPIESDADLPF